MKWKHLLIAFIVLIAFNFTVVLISSSPTILGDLLAPIDIPLLLIFIALAISNGIVQVIKKRKGY